jgi:hypothetical protein
MPLNCGLVLSRLFIDGWPHFPFGVFLMIGFSWIGFSISWNGWSCLVGDICVGDSMAFCDFLRLVCLSLLSGFIWLISIRAVFAPSPFYTEFSAALGVRSVGFTTLSIGVPLLLFKMDANPRLLGCGVMGPI